jgi:hypothetical protein
MYSMEDLVKAAEEAHAARRKPRKAGLLATFAAWVLSLLPFMPVTRK